MGDARFQQQGGFREDMYRNVDFGTIFQEMGFGGGFDFDSFFGGAAGAGMGGAGQRMRGGSAGGASARARAGAPGGGFRYDTPGAGRGYGGAEPDYSHYDVEHELDVGFFDIYNGSERQVNLTLSTGERVSARIKIPAGIEDGKVLRLKGQGASRPDAQRGDLYLKIKMLPHDQFARVGTDIDVDVEVPFSAMCLGASIEVSTPQGPKRTKIKAGMHSGVKIRLKGLGFPKGSAPDRGDLFAKLSVKIPEEQDLSPETRALLEKLRDSGL